MVWGILRSPIVLYFANFYLLGPFLFFKRRFGLFVLANVALTALLNYSFFLIPANTAAEQDIDIPADAWIGLFAGMFSYLLLNIAVIATAIGIRHFLKIRTIRQQLKEAEQRSTEAELAWLKNQINPHFLFNTLNNISSLTQIEPDKAQDAIAQLSDLLRYAMYETNKERVALSGEVEFMGNYVELMKLRCNEQTDVGCQFSVANPQTEVAPLLFISLIENAFKHGVSSSRPSSIDIRLEQTDNQIVFTCDNTIYPKDDTDRSGSGIGLENTRRRLELMYTDSYSWEQSLQNDRYHVRITINNKQ
jgi:LytS/YehU family sensor histidine kinase